VQLVAQRVTATGAIANTETQVVAYSIPANSLAAGDTFRIRAFYTRAGTNASQATCRVRVGTTTLTGNIAGTLTMPFAATAQPGVIEALVTVRTVGAAGTVGAGMNNQHNIAAGVNVSDTAPVAVDTTATKLIELTIISNQASNSYTFSYATIEKLNVV
jgi:hypothetical protein